MNFLSRLETTIHGVTGIALEPISEQGEMELTSPSDTKIKLPRSESRRIVVTHSMREYDTNGEFVGNHIGKFSLLLFADTPGALSAIETGDNQG